MPEPVDIEVRKAAARLANRAREQGQPSQWFEPLYQAADGDARYVPWADLEPHPLLHDPAPQSPKSSGRAAVVGCGLGDDAEWVAARADSVWAFDVSATAIEWAKQRWPDTRVQYEQADLFALPPERLGAFDWVVEVYTLQALPPESRAAASRAIASLLAPGGELWIITRIRPDDGEWGPVPWPLLRRELDALSTMGLEFVKEAALPDTDLVRSHWRRPAG
ncbi:MAG TPA: class I SAM-dependent methyltransferase [Fimbriimonadaceae bacterium]|nr:SAM-dependent methyltransferase [Armatimonadota bacterium]HRD30191.1 class I SAM-dependent methyltransferase [Fimbriimonadaceae bacterium]HRE94478.1 class I SAM-dependent methyltransferase [Fimbriimonadaceae bacterium]HRI74786.1 class I SAM-dependent methyltransferase [Fimbriimonadaceae bacterium]